jgi:hypothetical protein
MTVGGGDFVSILAARDAIGNNAEADAIQGQARAYINDLRVAESKRKEAFQQRWLALVPEIKKAMYEQIPWLVWTMAPDSLRESTRQEYLAKRNAAAHPANTTPVETTR